MISGWNYGSLIIFLIRKLHLPTGLTLFVFVRNFALHHNVQFKMRQTNFQPLHLCILILEAIIGILGEKYSTIYHLTVQAFIFIIQVTPSFWNIPKYETFFSMPWFLSKQNVKGTQKNTSSMYHFYSGTFRSSFHILPCFCSVECEHRNTVPTYHSSVPSPPSLPYMWVVLYHITTPPHPVLISSISESV